MTNSPSDGDSGRLVASSPPLEGVSLKVDGVGVVMKHITPPSAFAKATARQARPAGPYFSGGGELCALEFLVYKIFNTPYGLDRTKVIIPTQYIKIPRYIPLCFYILGQYILP